MESNLSPQNVECSTNQITSSAETSNGRVDIKIIDIPERDIFEVQTESWINLLREVTIPFLLAGFGMVAAGCLLDHVMEWPVYQDIIELVILVTPFLGLKGNLEMTFAARLSTLLNSGITLNKKTIIEVCIGNLLMTQIQACVCGMTASGFAMSIHYIQSGDLSWEHLAVLTSASLVTGSIVSLTLGGILIFTILVSKKYNVNPDNVATPIAGSLGDVITLVVLSASATIIWNSLQGGICFPVYIIYAMYVIVFPLFWIYVRKNVHVSGIVTTSCIPIVLAVLISTGGGFLLEFAGNSYGKFPLFQPLINGICGNLASILASKMSTCLHNNLNHSNNEAICRVPLLGFIKGPFIMTSRVLLALSIPGHFTFLSTVWFINSNVSRFDWVFMSVFIVGSIIQVAATLDLTKFLTSLSWRAGIEPDIIVIPFTTAFADLLGSAVLIGIFYVTDILENGVV